MSSAFAVSSLLAVQATHTDCRYVGGVTGMLNGGSRIFLTSVTFGTGRGASVGHPHHPRCRTRYHRQPLYTNFILLKYAAIIASTLIRVKRKSMIAVKLYSCLVFYCATLC